MEMQLNATLIQLLCLKQQGKTTYQTYDKTLFKKIEIYILNFIKINNKTEFLKFCIEKSYQIKMSKITCKVKLLAT